MKIFKRILLGFGITFGVIALTMVMLIVTINSVNASKGNHEEIMKSSQASPRKALVVYQPSISGIADDVAHRIAQGLNDNGFEVTINNPGDHLASNLSEYSVVVFGSPVYAGKVSDALKGFMKRTTDLSSSKIVLFSTGSSVGKTQELTEMETLLTGTAVFETMKFDAGNKEQAKALAYDLGAKLAK